jgi:HEAT repeat protein
MQSEAVRPSPPDPAKGLPPVVPPTGGFIAQLFLVPGLIVTGIVLLLLGVNWLIGGARTPEQFLKNLDNPNPEVRWRAADDLAQVLLRDEHLAADPRFALELAGRLHRGIDGVAEAEQAYAERLRALPTDPPEEERRRLENDGERKRLDAERAYVHYLMACLSDFTVPVAVPLLADLAVKPDVAAEADARVIRPEAAWASRRPEAVWALAKLGENARRFGQLPAEQQQAILDALAEEAAAGSERGRWAEAGRTLLVGRQTGKPQLLGLDNVFATCAADPDPFLRKITAYALNFWEGDDKENARLDDILLRLSDDDGQTTGETNPAQGLEIRYNAAAALARRGSDRARLDLLGQMLDEDRQLRNFHLKGPNGADQPDEGTARTTLVNALQAVAELHHKKPGRDLSELRSAVEKLAHDPDYALRAEAERTLHALDNP